MIWKTTKKISWLVEFIRGDAPEYGKLKQYVFAANAEAAIEHLKGMYGESTEIINIE